MGRFQTCPYNSRYVLNSYQNVIIQQVVLFSNFDTDKNYLTS